ncbi:hypothetical protein QR680_016932 [Steinernema hermaphroditum]|uniref:NADP-dependent oxidoreductase domain-containing protein n=1 Tax=Steinernema hermaphroditum TaxID=289476 RepID=A0AA39HCS0_9BILA|nr:hypothetical protein QR680_016932 [Steinernema hermaphroditum]
MVQISAKLSSGYEFPLVGLGTWQSKPGEVAQAVKDAVLAGYRHIDCAHIYGNQKEIGESLETLFAAGVVKREELFITSKIWNTFHSYEAAKELVEIMLKDLRLEYLDLCLIHWPMGYKEGGDVFPRDDNGIMQYSDADYIDTWKAMEEKVAEGKIKSIGLSNFSEKQIDRVIANGTIKPAALQVEMNVYLQQPELVKYCKNHEIVITAYSPLGNATSPMRKEHHPLLLDDEALKEIAQAHKKSVAQVAIRFLVQQGIVAIPKSTKEHRIRENFDVLDFSLNEEEMEKIRSLDKRLRISDLSFRDAGHPHFPWTN